MYLMSVLKRDATSWRARWETAAAVVAPEERRMQQQALLLAATLYSLRVLLPVLLLWWGIGIIFDLPRPHGIHFMIVVGLGTAAALVFGLIPATLRWRRRWRGTAQLDAADARRAARRALLLEAGAVTLLMALLAVGMWLLAHLFLGLPAPSRVLLNGVEVLAFLSIAALLINRAPAVERLTVATGFAAGGCLYVALGLSPHRLLYQLEPLRTSALLLGAALLAYRGLLFWRRYRRGGLGYNARVAALIAGLVLYLLVLEATFIAVRPCYERSAPGCTWDRYQASLWADQLIGLGWFVVLGTAG